MTALAFALCIGSALPAPVEVQASAEIDPTIVNARLEQVTPRGPFAEAFVRATARPGPLWVGYAVPIWRRPRFACCTHLPVSHWPKTGPTGRCALERPRDGDYVISSGASGGHSPRGLAILFRAQGGRLTSARTFTNDCELDAGGLPVVWLKGVTSSDSLRLLESLTRRRPREPHWEDIAPAVMRAIAWHADPEADQVLERLLAGRHP